MKHYDEVGRLCAEAGIRVGEWNLKRKIDELIAPINPQISASLKNLRSTLLEFERVLTEQ